MEIRKLIHILSLYPSSTEIEFDKNGHIILPENENVAIRYRGKKLNGMNGIEKTPSGKYAATFSFSMKKKRLGTFSNVKDAKKAIKDNAINHYGKMLAKILKYF